MDSLHAIVAEDGCVPRRLERLRVACGIGGATSELIIAGRRLPRESPVHPAMRVSLRSDSGIAPATVDAKLDTRKRRGARPGAADDLHRPGFNDAPAAEKIRDAGR